MRSVLRILPLAALLLLPACLAAPFVGAGSAAVGGGVSFFRDGDVRYADTIPFDVASAAINLVITEMGFNILSFDDHADEDYRRNTWKLRSDRGSAARLVLRQVTSSVTVLHIDIDVLGQGAASGPIAQLFMERYQRALNLAKRNGADPSIDNPTQLDDPAIDNPTELNPPQSTPPTPTSPEPAPDAAPAA